MYCTALHYTVVHWTKLNKYLYTAAYTAVHIEAQADMRVFLRLSSTTQYYFTLHSKIRQQYSIVQYSTVQYIIVQGLVTVTLRKAGRWWALLHDTVVSDCVQYWTQYKLCTIMYTLHTVYNDVHFTYCVQYCSLYTLCTQCMLYWYYCALHSCTVILYFSLLYY